MLVHSYTVWHIPLNLTAIYRLGLLMHIQRLSILLFFFSAHLVSIERDFPRLPSASYASWRKCRTIHRRIPERTREHSAQFVVSRSTRPKGIFYLVLGTIHDQTAVQFQNVAQFLHAYACYAWFCSFLIDHTYQLKIFITGFEIIIILRHYYLFTYSQHNQAI